MFRFLVVVVVVVLHLLDVNNITDVNGCNKRCNRSCVLISELHVSSTILNTEVKATPRRVIKNAVRKMNSVGLTNYKVCVLFWYDNE